MRTTEKKKKILDLSQSEQERILHEIEQRRLKKEINGYERGNRLKIVIVEKKDKEVSHCWKNLSIIMYVLVIVSGIASAKAMGDIIFLFSNRCILNATLSTEVDKNGTRYILTDFDSSRFGDASTCDFTQFFPVASVAVSGSLATFFAMCGRGGDTTRNLPAPWRMVPVSFLFNLIFVIISCVHVAYIYDGFSLFCKNIRPVNEESKIKSCSELFDAKVPNSKGEFDLKTNVVIAQVFSVMGLLGWILGFVVVLVRCMVHADFHVLTQVEYGPMNTGKKEKGGKSSGNNNKKKNNTEHEPLISSDSTDYEYSTPLTSINF